LILFKIMKLISIPYVVSNSGYLLTADPYINVVLFLCNYYNNVDKPKSQKMKRISSILLVIMAVGLISSCKPREKCPAYGKHLPKKHQSASHS
jgi:hypothetical protein